MAQQRQLYVLQREFLKCGLMLCFDIFCSIACYPTVTLIIVLGCFPLLFYISDL